MRALRTPAVTVVLSVLVVWGFRVSSPETPATHTPGYHHVAHVISEADFAALPEIHQNLLVALATREPNSELPLPCFYPPIDPALEAAVNDLYELPFDFQLGPRWTSTATTPSAVSQGDQVTLTYSFVPDGTSIPGASGFPSGTSSLFATFNAAFASTATWQGLFQQCFQRWGALTGVTYVLEPNDDGAPLSSSPGQLGVRGDLRISGMTLDGLNGVLAYNYFPPNGDMVLDMGDVNSFDNGGNNFRFLRNTVMHEHGHGQGLNHVCPTNGSKLMEPFINTGFDGPQFDDILGGQRQYGDFLEPNDTSAAATNMGSLNLGLTTASSVSIDDNSDVDWYTFTVPNLRDASVTVRPIGTVYNQAGQTSPCGAGSPFDPLVQNDLQVELIDSNGTTVLSLANSQPAGVNEVIPATFLPSGSGQYFIKVSGGTANALQPYAIDLVLTPGNPPLFSIDFPQGRPGSVIPDQSTAVAVQFTNGQGAPDPAAAFLFARIGTSGAFSATPLTDTGAGYLAFLPPAPCLATVEWYVSVDALAGGTVVSPAGAPNAVYTAVANAGLVTVFQDDFNGNLGWTVANDASLTGGAWERGVPVGGGTRGDPPTAFGGSGSCFLTENAPGNTDVDNGTTFLTSPAFSLVGISSASLSVALWLDNDFGGNPNQDPLFVQVSSNNGATWFTLEAYNQNADAWVERTYNLSAFPQISFTNQMRLRFLAQDLVNQGSVVEAGIDAVRVVACPQPMVLPVLGPAAAGLYPEALLTINGSTGGTDRRVDVPLGQPLTVAMAQPAGAPSPLDFGIFAFVGVPLTSDAVSLPGGFGDMAFPPCFLMPGNPQLLLLGDTLGTGLCGGPLLPFGPTPSSLTLPGAGAPLLIAIQGVVQTAPGVFATTNAVLLRAF